MALQIQMHVEKSPTWNLDSRNRGFHMGLDFTLLTAEANVSG